MDIILFLSKTYIIVLLLRYVSSMQELNFNPLGKVLFMLTSFLGKSNKNIPWVILLLVVISSALFSLAYRSNFIAAFSQAVTSYVFFFMSTYIVFIIFGSLGNRPIGGGFTSLFFRLGLPWVKMTRMIIPINSGKIVIPAVIVVYIIAVCLNVVLQFIFHAILNGDLLSNGIDIIIKSLALGAYNIFYLLFYMSFIIAARAIISWVSPDPRNVLVQFIYVVTEPVLDPLRKMIPPIGFIDFSALIAMMAFYFSGIILTGIVSPFI